MWAAKSGESGVCAELQGISPDRSCLQKESPAEMGRFESCVAARNRILAFWKAADKPIEPAFDFIVRTPAISMPTETELLIVFACLKFSFIIS